MLCPPPPRALRARAGAWPGLGFRSGPAGAGPRQGGIRAHLLGLGYTRVYGHVDASNTPAVWLHKLQGYKKVKAVEGRLYGKLFLHSGWRLFLRNPPVLARQKFDFRALW